MKIVTAVVNNPIFIEIQYHTLKKYFVGDYEFIVFNDAKAFPDFTNGNDITVKTQIEEMCTRLQIQCITIPNEGHRSNTSAHIRCADSMNYILQYQKQHPDTYLLLDSDMFLIDHFDIATYLKYDCSVVLQERNQFHYFWNGIYYFDLTKMKNIDLLNWECTHDGDVGAMMKDWLHIQMTNHSDAVYKIRHFASCDWDIHQVPERLKNNKILIDFLQNDVRNINGKFFCELYDGVFLHYRAGGNWRNEGMDVHHKLTHMLKDSLL